MLYGKQAFDPLLIIFQIITVQCLFYASLGVLVALLIGPYRAVLTTQLLFDWHLVRTGSFTGWMLLISQVANAVPAAITMRFVVARAKKCLDFLSTCYLLHLILCWISYGLPRNAAWWVSNLIALTIAVLLGELLCARYEMQDIVLGGSTNSRSSRVASRASRGPGDVELGAVDDELGREESLNQLLQLVRRSSSSQEVDMFLPAASRRATVV